MFAGAGTAYAEQTSENTEYHVVVQGGGNFLQQQRGGLRTGVGGRYVDYGNQGGGIITGQGGPHDGGGPGAGGGMNAYAQWAKQRYDADYYVVRHKDQDDASSASSEPDLGFRNGLRVIQKQQVATHLGYATVLVMEDWSLDFEDDSLWTMGETTQTCVPGGLWASTEVTRTYGAFWSLAWTPDEKPVLTLNGQAFKPKPGSLVSGTIDQNRAMIEMRSKHDRELQKMKEKAEKARAVHDMNMNDMKVQAAQKMQEANIKRDMQQQELEMKKAQVQMAMKDRRENLLQEMERMKMETKQQMQAAKLEQDVARLQLKEEQQLAKADAMKQNMGAQLQREINVMAAKTQAEKAKANQMANKALLAQKKNEIAGKGMGKAGGGKGGKAGGGLGSGGGKSVKQCALDYSKLVDAGERKSQRIWHFGQVEMKWGGGLRQGWEKRYLVLRDRLLDIYESADGRLLGCFPFESTSKFAAFKSDTCSTEGRLLGHERGSGFEFDTGGYLGRAFFDVHDMKTLTTWIHKMEDCRAACRSDDKSHAIAVQRIEKILNA